MKTAPLLAVAFLALCPCGGQPLDTSIDNLIDGSRWKITFPVAGPKDNALEITNPEFSNNLLDQCRFPDGLDRYFHRGDEGLVFHTEYTGVTTSPKTRYSRTELREMNGDQEANWTLEEGGTLEARLKIAALEGGANKLFFLQIHGKDPASEPLLKCLWEKGRIRLLTKSGPKLRDFSRQESYTDVPPGSWFTCAIHASRDTLTVSINGQTVESFGRDILDSWPAANTYYFKAGNYLQHDTPGAAATLVFSSIKISHGGVPPTSAPRTE